MAAPLYRLGLPLRNDTSASALHLNAMFRVFVQGNLNVNDYCRKMKGMVHALRDLGEPVGDHTLVLNILRAIEQTT
jgi:hypothetical protein